MSNTTAQTASALTFGDVVWGRPVVEGKTLPRRKGIVLGAFDGRPDQLIVWWYGMGHASSDTCTLMFARELTKAGDIFDFNGRKAAKLAGGCIHLKRANNVRNLLSRHARRMLSIGVK